MENYILKENETILFRGEATILPDGKIGDKNAKKADVLLTNFSIVLIAKNLLIR